MIPSGLEKPGPTVVPVTVYPATPDPERRRRRDGDEAVKTRSAAANVEVNEVGVGRGILFSRTRFLDCNLPIYRTLLWEPIARSIIYAGGEGTYSLFETRIYCSADSVCDCVCAISN